MRSGGGRAHWILAVVLMALLPVRGLFEASAIFHVRDLAAYFWPAHVWVAGELGQGRLPLWDPHPSLGQPAVSEPLLQLFFPPALLTRLVLPPVTGFNLFVALPLPFAAVGLWLFLRRRLPAAVCTLGALAFALSGPMVSCVNNPNNAWAAASIPWMLWAADGLDPPRRPRALAVLALAAGLGFLAAEPLTWGAGLILVLAHRLVAGGGSRTGAATAAAMTLGVGLAAVQALPALDVARRSIRGAGELADAGSMHPLRFLEALTPQLFGRWVAPPDAVGPWLGPLNDGREPYLVSIYLGVPLLALAAAGVGAGSIPARARVLWTTVALAAGAWSLGRYLPIYEALRDALPLLQALRYPPKLAVLVALAVAILAAAGFDGVLRGGRARRVGLAGALLGLLAAGVGLGIAATGARWLAEGLRIADPERAALFLTERVPGEAGRLALLALATLAALLLGRGREMAAAGLALVVVADLQASAWRLNPTLDAASLGPPPWVAATREHPIDRVYVERDLAGIGEPGCPAERRFDPREPIVAALSRWSALCLSFPSAWQVRETLSEDLTGLRAAEHLDLLEAFVMADREARARFLIRSGTRYYLARRPPSPAARALLDAGPGITLFEEPVTWPRASLVPAAHVEADPRRAIGALFDEGFDPRRLVVVPTQPSPAGRPGQPASPSVDLLEDAGGTLVVRARAPAAAYLVLLEGWDPHWTARVDGEPAPVLRANGLFRAVRVAPGEHEIRFEYRPAPFRAGLAVSAASALVLLFICWSSGRRVVVPDATPPPPAGG